MIFVDEDKYKKEVGIYAIVNKINNKVYIGQTAQNFQRRYWHHKWKLNDNTHDNHHLQAAWNKYGEDNFEFRVVECTENDRNKLNELEVKYISFYKEQNLSYNISSGGEGRKDVPTSEEAKKIIGQKNREHMTGRKASKETKEKMSKTRSGKTNWGLCILTPEQAREVKIRLTNGEKPSLIAKDMGIRYKEVNGILSNNTYKSVYVEGWEEFTKTRPRQTRITTEEEEEIIKDYKNGMNITNLAKKYNRTRSTIRKHIKRILEV